MLMHGMRICSVHIRTHRRMHLSLLVQNKVCVWTGKQAGMQDRQARMHACMCARVPACVIVRLYHCTIVFNYIDPLQDADKPSVGMCGLVVRLRKERVVLRRLSGERLHFQASAHRHRLAVCRTLQLWAQGDEGPYNMSKRNRAESCNCTT